MTKFSPDGKAIFLARNRDAREDLTILADAIAAVPGLQLFSDQDQSLVIIEDDKKVGVGPKELQQLILQHVVTKHAVETDGKWTVEYRPYDKADTTILLALLNPKTTFDSGGIIWRVSAAPRAPLTGARLRDAKERLQRGEDAGFIARALKTDVQTIQSLGRQPIVRREF